MTNEEFEGKTDQISERKGSKGFIEKKIDQTYRGKGNQVYAPFIDLE